ncbi:prepilin-type N-terminal cleavage/methylation domain-containing protein [Candidatus Wolfebacteria bacterium]|nr:prepilin-type N-terminal cleavage/methylation domain-containing protein [Candidatus Wolfebacteria bacterium]
MLILNYLGCRNLKPITYNLKPNSGFTLLELLVVMSLTIILTGGLLIYSRGSERQLILLRDEAKIIGALQQAKSMALSVAGGVCGYGVHFEQSGKIIVFKDLSSSPDCTDADNKYIVQPEKKCGLPESECISQTSLDKTIQFSDLNFNDIVFIPPDLTVIIDNNVSKTKAWVKIRVSGGVLEREIIVNNSGQISEK